MIGHAHLNLRSSSTEKKKYYLNITRRFNKIKNTWERNGRQLELLESTDC